jgi:hypothetical protein
MNLESFGPRILRGVEVNPLCDKAGILPLRDEGFLNVSLVTVDAVK